MHFCPIVGYEFHNSLDPSYVGLFFLTLATGVRRYGGFWSGCYLLQSVIPWRMAGIILGADLFFLPILRVFFLVFPCFVPFVALEYVWNFFGGVSTVS